MSQDNLIRYKSARCLFGRPSDTEEKNSLLTKMAEMMSREKFFADAAEKWGYDYKSGRPLENHPRWQFTNYQENHPVAETCSVIISSSSSTTTTSTTSQ